MATHVALLRGINVGGHNRVSMTDLRNIVASLGHTGVVTYIQSGNVVFTAGDAGPGGTGGCAAALEQAIADALDVRPKVIVLTRGELGEVVRASPYAAEPNPKYVHAVFFPGNLGPDTVTAVAQAERQAAERGSRDRATVAGRVLYLHTPDGFGRSELAALLLNRPRSQASAGTARNWATVTKLLALCHG